MNSDHWTLTVAALAGEPWPELPALPGRVIRAPDEPIDPTFLEGVTSPQELSVLLGISRGAAWARLKKGTTP